MATKPVVTQVPSPLAHPVVGTALTVLAGVSFMIVGMLLPLVGPAGAVTPHSGKNMLTFLAVLLVSLALSLAATASKLARRHIDRSPPPIFSLLLSFLCGVLLLALFAGLLKI